VDRKPGKTICFGVCSHGHALLWVGEERVRLTSEQLKTLIRLGTETLVTMGVDHAIEVDAHTFNPLPVSTELH